ncbi:MAG: hypothetical protein VX869_03710, partial [Chloroflexota bacterium]|nr:hypothetical protein [Chloroflexota bacterium]
TIPPPTITVWAWLGNGVDIRYLLITSRMFQTGHADNDQRVEWVKWRPEGQHNTQALLRELGNSMWYGTQTRGRYCALLLILI